MIPNPLAWTVVLNMLFLVLAAAVAHVSASLAVWSEVLHMAGDLAALAVAVLAAWLHHFDRRAGPTGGLLQALFLLSASGWICFEGVERLWLGHVHHPPDGGPMFAVALAAIGVNVLSALLMARRAGGDLNARGVYLHMVADAAGAVAALVASLLVLGGIPEADALASLGIAAAVIAGAVPLLWASTRALRRGAQRQHTTQVSPCPHSADKVLGAP